MAEERAVYVISVAAELAGVHPQTLRIYERKGLLQPQRTAGNTRRYSDADIDRLRLIQALTQDGGVNLAGVKAILAMQDEIERLRDELLAARREMSRLEDRLMEQVQAVHRSYRRDLVPLRNMPVPRR